MKTQRSVSLLSCQVKEGTQSGGSVIGSGGIISAVIGREPASSHPSLFYHFNQASLVFSLKTEPSLNPDLTRVVVGCQTAMGDK